jgi:hypothetical protein
MSTEETRSEGREPNGTQGPERRGPANGAGVAALVLGIVGVVTALTGWLVVTLPIALATGVLALYLGLRGRRMASRGEATNRGQALAGVVLGSTALGLIVAGGLAFAVKGGDRWDRWDRHDDDDATIDRCIDRADNRGELVECLREFPREARAAGIILRP